MVSKKKANWDDYIKTHKPKWNKDVEDKLFDLYYNKGFLFGRDKLYKRAIELGIDVSRRMVAKWLKEQEVNQLFRNTKRARKIKPTILDEENKQVALDLIDYSKQEYHEYKWIFTAIDLFSKKAFAEPMKSKDETDIIPAFKKILNQIGHSIKSVRSDNGSEFASTAFKKLLEEKHIHQVFSLPAKPQSNGNIERFNGVLKGLIKKYLYVNKTYDWVSAIPILLENYNSAIHETTKKTPNSVADANQETKETIKKNITKKVAGKLEKDVADIPDHSFIPIVRIKQEGETTPWSKETYLVEKVYKPKNNIGTTYYKLKGLNKRFYNNDIQVVNNVENKTETSKQYEVSKLVRPSVSGGRAGYIVKWKGYLKSSDDTWQSRERLLEIGRAHV